MQEEGLRFVVTNSPDFDMDLLEEAYWGHCINWGIISAKPSDSFSG